MMWGMMWGRGKIQVFVCLFVLGGGVGNMQKWGNKKVKVICYLSTVCVHLSGHATCPVCPVFSLKTPFLTLSWASLFCMCLGYECSNWRETVRDCVYESATGQIEVYSTYTM